jgi:hypothetical protein
MYQGTYASILQVKWFPAGNIYNELNIFHLTILNIVWGNIEKHNVCISYIADNNRSIEDGLWSWSKIKQFFCLRKWRPAERK